MSGFFRHVYAIVARIPEGSVTTYGLIAEAIGCPRGARTVGWAMHSIPRNLDLPAHRVVNRTGTLAPGDIFGSSEIQRLLLASEGVTFLADGRINLRRHLWIPDSDLAE
ncbi:MAG: MGMT family protein [bacterium]|jgi:methylated-DNA-protein-cysteine methyltransferase-like protein